MNEQDLGVPASPSRHSGFAPSPAAPSPPSIGEMVDQDSGASCGPGSREPSPSVSAASGFDPSRVPSDLDRAFEIAVKALHLNDDHQEGARLLFADDLNNRNGRLSEYMAGRVIAATFAALRAIEDERSAIAAWLLGRWGGAWELVHKENEGIGAVHVPRVLGVEIERRRHLRFAGEREPHGDLSEVDPF